MRKSFKILIFALPLFFAIHLQAVGVGSGRADASAGDVNAGRSDLPGTNGGYYNSGYYNNGGYAPILLPEPVLTPNDDMDSLYNQNLKNMQKTGQ